ncbi:aspartyl/asparaginyl beta-hydroxylase isoform X8 [Anopheles gambiae]|uniref:aspartyl/asparaginyl beta-hydroxylase isoform X8 n=1 Tax=Anopheles gambiae TaxID=7165 RepID=UPI002AC8EC05|nr:aspartyl/asparaginyl beta-hydroxylase isoform X8 [Anopheles gambiae]XP_061496715.1 aspartyl/asparaginyl beta-hydroxylase isoform X8 [Anopheles gambiae]XP_061496716.1 aspartyl/asparaginyl beta-hydroxylase isoform X8 [Anopheles gambiae]XP_061496717.1 aspartyl/asparaginyl beta-hydroxylase isoform X8 [Anopheles gambiae]XP_061496718.1 aspartyl/asparaginyl beta-hydroxylase isoform X8 [Anopheles gambiae]XP_061496719.1 aspartyl/asparaginyl beta-hydroxylase isoform X8 [Anopheles gambiae]XP_06149672
MSGDTQAKKRKDKKRKKDDEDTVKETTVHAPKQPSAGAAQAAKEPGDVQMHIQSDHGTGGHWCAKVVFFILLAGLGALIGLIIMENQGVSNEDTPLSESRYSEFFNGWVDENRQDDHHHDEVLAAINSLDDHDDEGDAHHAVEDHDGGEDDGHDQDGDDDDHDDGAPYAEEEDHDDDEDGTEVQDDDEDEGPASKLDDDEVEEIYTQQEAAEQQQAAADDDDDGDDDGQDDDDEDDDAEPAGNADDDDDNQNELANEDDDDDQDDTPFDEVKRSNALNDNANRNVPTINEDTVQTSVPEPERNQVPVTTTVPSTEGAVTGDTLKDQMDELVRNYNKLAESLDVPKVEEVVDFPDTIAAQVNEDANDDGDEEEILEVTRGSQPANDDDDDDVDDDDAAFSELVDNDGGEEEYLEKLRAEQQRRAAAEAERRAAAEPEEETSQIPSRAEEADRSYQEELRRAEQQLDENKPQEALAAFDRILLRTPNSIDALIGRARSLDALAEQRRSNAILTEAIAAYRKVIEHELSVDDGTLKTVAERCIDRMRFQGQHAQAIEVHNVLIRRFDNEPLYRNQLAVSYLYLNRLAEAKAVLHETLLRWIDNGFALVHYGFVLKTLDQNMELAAQYLQEGIETGHPGTQDGRFYFQLGDALQRLGRNSEARAVYRKGVQKKLFRSVYQRSLYNVDGLAARPYWTEEQTTYATELELIRAKWREVRDEGLKLLTSAGVFVNESENLRDRGDWKQLELFSRGARVERNCARAPYTCRLVEQYFPAARTCKRGQVKFSVMHPGTHVWPHCGPTNCRVRAHLGLRVPPGTYIRVAEETRSWENGKWLIFDDSFEHEVWHNGTETRLVLIVDFWHPELTESQRRTLSPI